MSAFEKIGVESRVSTYLPPGAASGAAGGEAEANVGKVRAELHLAAPFPEGEWLAVEVVAQVFDREYVDRFNRSAEQALIAEGPPVAVKARSSKLIVDLPLPPMPFGVHPVKARVYSVDERYRKLFEPDDCFLRDVAFGYLSRITQSELVDVYRGVGNPAAEEEIKRLVRAGAVVVEHEGKLFEPIDEGGALRFRPFRQFETTPRPAQDRPLATGRVAIEGAALAVAELFAKNGELMAGQLAPLVIAAARTDAEVARRLHAMGPSPRFHYVLGPPAEAGNRVEFPVTIYPRE